MWNNFYTQLKGLNLGRDLIIYTHNLGSFDYYLLPSIYSLAENKKQVNQLIDEKGKFIQIQYRYSTQPNLNKSEEQMVLEGLTEEDYTKKDYYKWTFLDSCRLFPMSLNQFCEMFNVKGKTSEYNPKWNDITFMKDCEALNELFAYSKQDSISLLEAVLNARSLYNEKYGVDNSKVVSLPSLSLLIFRTKFLEKPIQILNKSIDNIVRPTYYGGSTDVYIKHAKHVKYYDVNSLYPTALLQDMPGDYKGMLNPYTTKLEDIFRFVEVIITCPKNIQNPILIHHSEGRNIHPTGTWQASYFS